MNLRKLSRREAIAHAGIVVGVAVTGKSVRATPPAPAPADAASRNASPFLYCLNTATIRGQKLGLVKEIEIAVAAGYDAIEPWVGSIEEYAKKGGSLKDVKKRLEDSGVTVESAIGFPEWIVDDDAKRSKG